MTVLATTNDASLGTLLMIVSIILAGEDRKRRKENAAIGRAPRAPTVTLIRLARGVQFGDASTYGGGVRN
jgi:hypothetical protein